MEPSTIVGAIIALITIVIVVAIFSGVLDKLRNRFMQKVLNELDKAKEDLHEEKRKLAAEQRERTNNRMSHRLPGHKKPRIYYQ